MANRVKSFREELEKQEAHANEENAKTSSTTPSDTSRPEAADRAALAMQYAVAQRRQINQQFILQLRQLEAAIQRGDFEEARQMLDNLQRSGMGTPPPEGWEQFSTTLYEAIQQLAREAQQKWYQALDDLVKQAHDKCLTADTSADLDALFLRATALQMKRFPGNDALTQRGNEKLNGIVTTLQDWARFLDQRYAGNPKAANDILQRLSNNSSAFPILTLDEIRSKLISIEEPESKEARAHRILQNIGGPDDLPRAIKQWVEMQDDPKLNAKGYGGQELTNLQTLEKAWASLRAGNSQEVLDLLGDAVMKRSMGDMNPYFSTLKNDLVHSVVAAEVRKLPGFKVPANLPVEDSMRQALDHLYQKGEFQKTVDLMQIAEHIEGMREKFPRGALDKFLTARRFEESKDIIPAILIYREVLEEPPGPYVPHEQAGQALQRLQTEHPDLFKDPEMNILAEMRGLLEDLRSLNSRLRMMRIMPGRP